MTMETIIPDDCHEELREVFETLVETRKNIFNLIQQQLRSGECNYLSDDMYGFPYDYELYAKDSFDPRVQKLNSLLEKIEETFSELVVDHIEGRNNPGDTLD